MRANLIQFQGEDKTIWATVLLDGSSSRDYCQPKCYLSPDWPLPSCRAKRQSRQQVEQLEQLERTANITCVGQPQAEDIIILGHGPLSHMAYGGSRCRG